MSIIIFFGLIGIIWFLYSCEKEFSNSMNKEDLPVEVKPKSKCYNYKINYKNNKAELAKEIGQIRKEKGNQDYEDIGRNEFLAENFDYFEEYKHRNSFCFGQLSLPSPDFDIELAKQIFRDKYQ